MQTEKFKLVSEMQASLFLSEQRVQFYGLKKCKIRPLKTLFTLKK